MTTFKNNLRAAQADWQFIEYAGARHGFTNPDAGKYGMQPIAYDAAADRRSWQALQVFFDEIFAVQ